MFLESVNQGAPALRWDADESPEALGLSVCFPAEARIQTPGGPRAAADLRPGDRVWCLDGGSAEVVEVDHCLVRAETMAAPALWPVVIEPDALGEGVPERRVTLSPGHRICLCHWQAELHFAAPEVLVPARALVNGATIRQDPPSGPVLAVRFLLARHEVILVEGLLSEAAFLRRFIGGAPRRPEAARLALAGAEARLIARSVLRD